MTGFGGAKKRKGTKVHLVVETLGHLSKIELIVMKRPDASRGVVLLPKRWVVERSLAWLSRFRRLERDLERLSSIGFHFVAACVLLLTKLSPALERHSTSL